MKRLLLVILTIVALVFPGMTTQAQPTYEDIVTRGQYGAPSIWEMVGFEKEARAATITIEVRWTINAAIEGSVIPAEDVVLPPEYDEHGNKIVKDPYTHFYGLFVNADQNKKLDIRMDEANDERDFLAMLPDNGIKLATESPVRIASSTDELPYVNTSSAGTIPYPSKTGLMVKIRQSGIKDPEDSKAIITSEKDKDGNLVIGITPSPEK